MATATKAPDPSADEIVELCRLLVGADRERILAAIDRIDDRHQFAEYLSTVLGEAMRLGAIRDDQLGKALGPLISTGVHATVRRDPGKFGEALAPAMGPAIRQAVRQMIQSLTEGFERTLEQSLTVRGWKWRVQAWRTGKPFAEIALLHTLRYRVEHVFLIHRDTGLLLNDASRQDVESRDADLVSAMLTAIQDFVKDAFEAPEGDTLGSFQVGDLRVWVEQGSHAVLAVVIRGQAPQSERTQFRQALEQIELGYATQLAEFDGDVSIYEGTTPLLETCLTEQRRDGSDDDEKPARKRGTSIVLSLVIIGGLIALSIWWFLSWRASARWRSFVDLVRQEAGIQITHAEESDGRFRIEGLRDPLARDPLELARQEFVDVDQIDARWQPFHAPHAPFVLARLREDYGVPQGVTLELNDGVLRVLGDVPEGWMVGLREYVRHVPAVVRVD